LGGPRSGERDAAVMTISSSSVSPPSMKDALSRLWIKFLPEIENRLVALESAALALEAGTLADSDREAAHQAAHKLAGVLGTFGLHRGTELARQAEVLLDEDDANPSATDLSSWVGELRSLIENRK
jgi:HPt (histidine-containing phosphotransfer) domain-containing protein